MSANDKIADGIQAHSIDLERFSIDLQNRILPILDRVERSLVEEVAKIDPSGAATLTNRQKRTKALLRQTQGTIATGYDRIKKTVGDDLQDIAKLSDTAGRKIVNDAIGVEIMTVAVAPETLRALADETMVQGAVVKEHWDRQEASLRQKFQDRVTDGVMRGEPSTEIINRVRGTKARGYTDGIMTTTKAAAGALVRTSVQTVANSARLEVFRANSDILKGVRHVSTLDNRTTMICIARSGLEWDLDGNPIGHGLPFRDVPLHWNCLPGDSLVTPCGRITGVSKRWFDGDLVVIRTSHDFEIACTPNHPILTNLGWLPAKAINQTHHVVCDFRSKFPVPMDGDDYQIPARIEDIADTFFRSSEVVSSPMEISPEDFHGDGVQGEVAIVGTNRSLPVEDHATFSEHGISLNLVMRDAVPPDILHTDRSFGFGLQTIDLPSAGDLSRSGQPLPFVGGSSVHPCLLLGSVASQGDASLSQDPLYGTWTDAECFSDATYANAFSIKFDDVTVVQSRPYRGHVYNLETEKSVYVANGIINHNCRSTLVSVLKPWREVSEEVTAAVKAKSPKSQVDEKLEGIQASMDGPVSADLNYEEWLKTKPLEFQLEVLGPTKHKLWKDGKITFRDLVDQRGNPLTLAEIIAKVESGQTTTARGETMRKAKEAAATVDDLEKKAAAAEKDVKTQVNRSVKAGYVTEEERDRLKEYRETRIDGQEPAAEAVEAFDKRPEWLQDRVTAAINTKREALKAKEQAGPAAEYAKRKAVAESAQRLKSTLHDPAKVAEWVPGQITDGELNGVPFAPWKPADGYNWMTAKGRTKISGDAALPLVFGSLLGAVTAILEEDGRVWMYQPVTAEGVAEALPSGILESGMDAQAIALREAWEATGLQAEIVSILGDYRKPNSVMRYYIARRIGGAPWLMGHEARSVKLVPVDELSAIATDDTDKAMALDLAAAYRKAMLAREGDLMAGLKAIMEEADDFQTAATKRRTAMLREWVEKTAKGQAPSAAAVAVYAGLAADEKAAYAALAKEKSR